MSAQTNRRTNRRAVLQMETTLLDVIARGTLPQRYQHSVGQFVRAQDGRQIRLQGPDNKLTPAGKAYWRLRGMPAPSQYD